MGYRAIRTVAQDNMEVPLMQRIPLSQRKFAIVDDEDFTLFSEFKWCYRAERNGKPGYAVRHAKLDGKDRLLYMHRVIMQPKPGQEVIFLNYDRLDCRRANLRAVTKEEAKQHHRVRSDSKSGVKNVRFNEDLNTWSAVTYRNGRCFTLGTYFSKEAAAAAYESYLRRENPALHKAPERVEAPTGEQTDLPSQSQLGGYTNQQETPPSPDDSCV